MKKKKKTNNFASLNACHRQLRFSSSQHDSISVIEIRYKYN